MIQQRRVMSIPPVFSVRYRAPAAAAAVPWWLAGGAPTPIVVYQPKGAADLAASYVNLVQPGTYNAAPGTAPTLDASGWVFNGSSQYLKTGYRLPAGTSKPTSMAIRYSGAIWGTISCLAGVDDYNTGVEGYAIRSFLGNYQWLNGGTRNETLDAADVVAIAGSEAYKSGSSIGSIPDGTLNQEFLLVIGASNHTLTGIDYNVSFFYSGKIQAVAIWNTSTNHATWMPAVMAAVALI